jgi:hypothetical protein
MVRHEPFIETDHFFDNGSRMTPTPLPRLGRPQETLSEQPQCVINVMFRSIKLEPRAGAGGERFDAFASRNFVLLVSPTRFFHSLEGTQNHRELSARVLDLLGIRAPADEA